MTPKRSRSKFLGQKWSLSLRLLTLGIGLLVFIVYFRIYYWTGGLLHGTGGDGGSVGGHEKSSGDSGRAATQVVCSNKTRTSTNSDGGNHQEWRRQFVGYMPSAWEREWHDRARQWGSHERPGALCKQLALEQDRIATLMTAIAGFSGRKPDAWRAPDCFGPAGVTCFVAHGLPSAQPSVSVQQGRATTDLTDVFSRLVYKYERVGDGSNDAVEISELIEPLVGMLRDPSSVCTETEPAGVDKWGKLFSKDHLLLLSNRSRLQIVRRQGSSQPFSGTIVNGRAFLFDIGSGHFDNGPGGPIGSSTKWLVDSFGPVDAQGHPERWPPLFDMIAAWESEPQILKDVYSAVPAELIPRYNFYNVPASGVPGDGLNPLDAMARVARPDDFVVFKLDIDAPELELQLVHQLLNNATLISLVDEFMWEHHVNSQEMLKWWHTESSTQYLIDSYDLFAKLRSKGIRSHSWP